MIQDDLSRSELIRPTLAARVDPVWFLYLPIKKIIVSLFAENFNVSVHQDHLTDLVALWNIFFTSIGIYVILSLYLLGYQSNIFTATKAMLGDLNYNKFHHKNILTTELCSTSYYPLHPPAEDVNIDYEQFEKYALLPYNPDILILPSDLRYFAKVYFSSIKQLDY